MLTNLDLPFHPLPILVPTPLLHQVVLLESPLETVLQVCNLQLPRIEIRVSLNRTLVLVVEFRDSVPDRVCQSRSRVRELCQLGSGLCLELIVSGRSESAGMQVGNVRDATLKLLNLVLNALNLHAEDEQSQYGICRVEKSRRARLSLRQRKD